MVDCWILNTSCCKEQWQISFSRRHSWLPIRCILCFKKITPQWSISFWKLLMPSFYFKRTTLLRQNQLGENFHSSQTAYKFTCKSRLHISSAKAEWMDLLWPFHWPMSCSFEKHHASPSVEQKKYSLHWRKILEKAILPVWCRERFCCPFGSFQNYDLV